MSSINVGSMENDYDNPADNDDNTRHTLDSIISEDKNVNSNLITEKIHFHLPPNTTSKISDTDLLSPNESLSQESYKLESNDSPLFHETDPISDIYHETMVNETQRRKPTIETYSSAPTVPIKKSILKPPSSKQQSKVGSRIGIQWEQDVIKEKSGSSKILDSSIIKMFISGRSKRFGEILADLRSGKELPPLLDFDEIVWRRPHRVQLTLQQQTMLEIMKITVKRENEIFIKSHPEVSILILLIYRKLAQHRPKDPKRFVAEYVHYLNKHRDELINPEVDVFFDKSDISCQSTNISSSLEETTQEKFDVLKKLVEHCAEMASYGDAYYNITCILNNLLSAVVPRESVISTEEKRSAEEVVFNIISSILKSVRLAKTTSSEIVVEDILNEILEEIPSSVSNNTEKFVTVKESVELFIRDLIKSLI